MSTIIEIPLWLLYVLGVPAFLFFVIVVAIVIGLILTARDFEDYGP